MATRAGPSAISSGEENKGLAAMFTMMNNARLNVGVQGVGIAERAFQQALAYAHERRQGRARSGNGGRLLPDRRASRRPPHAHDDEGADRRRPRDLLTSPRPRSIDRAARADETARSIAAERASLLTPVAKAFATDIANEVASLGVQVHGGAGFIEETGAAQFMRDARIAAIYEGTNGIQAIDLATRKLGLSDGEAVQARDRRHARACSTLLQKTNADGFGEMEGRLFEAVEAFERATLFMLDADERPRPTMLLAGASPYLRLFALARGGTALARGALAAQQQPGGRRERPFARDAGSRRRGSSPTISRAARPASSFP